MEESTYQEHHTMKRVTLKSSSTNLNGESRINYNILGWEIILLLLAFL